MTPQAYRYLLGQVASGMNWMNSIFTRDIGDDLDIFCHSLKVGD